jgi:glycosyltransferase involved in cell wall biosynthesis
MRVLVVVPAFNEALNLPGVIGRLRDFGYADICVVDDGSTDETSAIARALGVVVLRNPFNLGIGGAVQTGYLWALKHGYDAAAQIDGDGQHDPAYLEPALELITEGSTDLAIGGRFTQKDGFRSTFARRLGIRYLAWLLHVRCGAKVSDPTSGFRVAGRRAIALFAKHYPSDYPEPEAIAMALRSGLTVTEVSVRMQRRLHGRSSIDAWRTLYYLLKVSLAILLVRTDHPREAEPSSA